MQRVLFIGCYGRGRRTLVNALLRKEVLNTSIVETTPFVTEIVSGDCERCFSINKDGSKELLNLDELSRKIMMHGFDIDSSLLYAKYVVHECPAQANNLTFTISDPCMQEYGYEQGQYGREILTHPCWKNDAVVYLLNATMPFTQPDCDYIEHDLSDGSNSNLFFCINRMDCVPEEDVSELKKYTKEKLKKVFTRDGVFDEALYQNRVFFISAYYSLTARLGKPLHYFFRDVYVKDIDTGVPEFEYTLRKFLQKQSIEKQRAMEQLR